MLSWVYPHRRQVSFTLGVDSDVSVTGNNFRSQLGQNSILKSHKVGRSTSLLVYNKFIVDAIDACIYLHNDWLAITR